MPLSADVIYSICILLPGEEVRMQMEYERDWLSTMMRKYVDLLYKIPAEGEGTRALHTET